MPLSPSVALTQVQARWHNAQVLNQMQATDVLSLEWLTMVDVVDYAGVSRKPRRFKIHSESAVEIAPCL